MMYVILLILKVDLMSAWKILNFVVRLISSCILVYSYDFDFVLPGYLGGGGSLIFLTLSV